MHQKKSPKTPALKKWTVHYEDVSTGLQSSKVVEVDARYHRERVGEVVWGKLPPHTRVVTVIPAEPTLEHPKGTQGTMEGSHL